MADFIHANATQDEGIHRAVAGTIADSTAFAAGSVVMRTVTGAVTVSAAEVDKIFRRLDTGERFWLVNHSPVTWRSAEAPLERSVRITSNVTNSTTSLADVTGLSFVLESGIRYEFVFNVIFQTAATTTGLGLSLNGPAFTQLSYNVVIPTSATAQTLGFRRAYNVATTGTAVDVLNADLLATIRGTVVPSASGTLIVRFASEIASSNAVVQAGSYGWLRVVP